ncbi:tyrosine-type recombinase/integrase [Sinorhizobium glycinis]|uniref:tyrosine-type recombinase/integrase n=1 Tax=Sinorhizobium glycinis TaxID=1472378 RepID=UPI000A589D89|nr:tyrosine-type recombinase/integrase [Sinorhizobium glycinis]
MSSWNSGRIISQKPPLKPKEVWAIRTRLQMAGAVRDLALFNLAIDSKLRACDLVAISVADVAISGRVRDRAIIIQRKTGRPAQFELTDQTREAVAGWIGSRRLGERDYLFPSRVRALPHLSTRQYGRIVERWVSSIGLSGALNRGAAGRPAEGQTRPVAAVGDEDREWLV